MADNERPSDEPERDPERSAPADESPTPAAAIAGEPAPAEPTPGSDPLAAGADQAANVDEPAPAPEPAPVSSGEGEPALPSDGPDGPSAADIATDLPEPSGEAPADPAPAEPGPSAEAPPGADAADEPPAAEPASGDADAEVVRPDRAAEAPRDDAAPAAPAVPGAHLEPDLVLESDRIGATPDPYAPYSDDEQPAEPVAATPIEDAPDGAPVASTPLELAAGARYQATGKRKTSVARVILKPGTGVYLINGRALDEFFPRPALLKRARQPLEATGNDARMDVVARIHGGGVSSQAGALRHGVARALVEADPNLRGELKRAGFLTRDARVKERKKAGLKKARKRPQFSKR